MLNQSKTTSNTLAAPLGDSSSCTTYVKPKKIPYNVQLDHKIKTEKLIRAKGYKKYLKDVLLAIAEVTPQSLITRPSQEYLSYKTGWSVSTVKRAISTYKADGVLLSEQLPGRRKSGDTNQITMLYLETKLPTVETCVNYNINNLDLNLKDLTNNITQDLEYVSLLANLENIKPPKETKPEKHVDNKKLESDPESEIKRACVAYGLREDAHEYVCNAMKKQTNVANPGAYLAGILKKIKENGITYKTTITKTPEDDGREAALRKWQRTQEMLAAMDNQQSSKQQLPEETKAKIQKALYGSIN